MTRPIRSREYFGTIEPDWNSPYIVIDTPRPPGMMFMWEVRRYAALSLLGLGGLLFMYALGYLFHRFVL
jgi:hypothetical protein